MMDTAILRSRILDLAIRGKLVGQDPSEGTAEELLKEIGKQRGRTIEPITGEVPFEIPDSWRWVRLGELADKITDFVASGSFASLRENVTYYNEPNYAILVRTKDFGSDFKEGLVYTDRHGYEFLNNSNLFGGELILSNIGSIGKVFIVPALNQKMTLAPNSIMIQESNNIIKLWYYYFFKSSSGQDTLHSISSSTTQAKFNKTDLRKVYIPLPPLSEQKRIVERVEELLKLVDAIETAQTDIKQISSILRSRVLDEAMNGGLTNSDTSSWKWVKMCDVADIARGGSPRPIKDFLTDSPNGVNWIKIGDTEKGGKYINSCKERIIKEGVRRSRLVHPGDFLLTNSMSFGRPYISNIEGCIHDGWLVISPNAGTFDKDYLYFLLSSTMVYKQFCDQASGSTVSNLNIDKVSVTTVPLPPLAEQHRIVSKIEEIFAQIDELTR